ncbi:pre-B-cell leukemia transcription factor-interacting protein 1-like isoform X4 [Sinocyclocheilus grahami]|uniref:pre-B-cell leukemia transcription factor-interacting protein 1-like isoform X4 n=1 Tax=Sinocyclocheilus grahami TaxID=75366 RepID=UPI0007ACC09A|nr:PREDICTED: pre-B-cell leukemia transcription factor-interacting protein 1-like isoform X4 [Sinocyclocheilus grahami]
MSDNSTGSTGSSSNSWTLLSPEEAAAVDPTAPVDDGTESIGDAPSLSEEIAGSSLEVRSHDPEPPMVETFLSEEGHQVSASLPICQETSPDFFEKMAASGHTDTELDSEIHAPVIHDTITSSPPDSDLLGAAPFSIATESAFQFSDESVLDEPTEEDVTDIFPGQHVPVQESPAPEPESKIPSTSKPFREISSSPDVPVVTADINPIPEISDSSAAHVLDIHADVHPAPETPPLATPSETDTGFGSTVESPAPDSPYPETIGSFETEEEATFEKEDIELPEKFPDVIREPAGPSAEDDGLRLRHVQPTILLKRSSDDEEEEEEEEFNLPARKEEKRGFSLNHLIVGALVLLCVGSFFFSGSVVDLSDDDFEGTELSDQELLDKLAQENKQINILEAQIESQKEELDQALKMAADKHNTEKGALENQNIKMKEQLSELPGLKEELQTLRARVTELTKLTVEEDLPQQLKDSGPPSTAESSLEGTEKHWDKKEELKRQKTLLEESRKRLEGMKKQDWNKQGLRESLMEIQKRLSKQVDQLGKREECKRKHQEHKGEKEWGRKKEHDSRWKKDEAERGKEWKHGKDKRRDLKKYKEEWDHKKDERRQERERRQKERPWEAKPSKHHHHHHHHHHQEQIDFWKHQEEKLRRNRHRAEGCHGISNCADAEGLVPVKLTEFQDLLEIYLSKLDGVPQESKESLSRLTAQFFSGGVFAHDRMLFSEFAKDIADILEDLADGLEGKQHDNDSLEEEMEEFEKEALLQFAAPLA